MAKLVSDEHLADLLRLSKESLFNESLSDTSRASGGLTSIRTRALQVQRHWLQRLKEGPVVTNSECPFGDQDGKPLTSEVILAEYPNPWLDIESLEIWKEFLHVLSRLARLAESRNIDSTILLRPPMRMIADFEPLEILLERLEVVEEVVKANADALDLAAERAAEKAARLVGGTGAKGTSDLSADAEPIDEHDAAVLEFLSRTPHLRRRVSDVLPATGPQDRKAVAKRLRKLAGRSPPLVDYPKEERTGVAILPAGIEALKRARPPAPR